jgi:hypothetical protein
MSHSNFSLRLSIVIATISILAGTSWAQNNIRINDAESSVGNPTGLIAWSAYDQFGTKQRLSFPDKSFAYFKFNNNPNKVYTNHDAPPTPDKPIGSGVVSRRGPAGRDTVTYKWTSVEGVDIFQDMWGVDVGGGKGQIVVHWRFFNSGSTSAEIQTQYLLDVQVVNDGSKTLTRHGYRTSWTQYTRGQLPDIPPFFINFQNDLPNAPSFDPGLSGMGFIDRKEWGVNQPNRMTICHWPEQEQVAWGPKSPLPTTQITDNAILMEWDAVTATPGKEVSGPSFSYGTGDYFTCNGNLFALLFYPRKLTYDAVGDKYIPNPFNVEAFIFNPEKIQSASNVKLKLEVGQNLNIVATPTNLKSQEVVPNPSSIQPEGVTSYTWQIKADLNRPCTGPLLAPMTLTAVSSLGPPYLIDCIPEVELPCTERDVLPPEIKNMIGEEVDTIRKFDVVDGRTDDKGLEKITYVQTLGDPTNFVVTIPPFQMCTRAAVPVKIEQLDSTKEGCLEFTFTDCAGNFTTREFCFMKHDTVVVVIPDTLAPVFTLVARVGSDNGTECNALRDSIEVTEKRDHDKGIAAIVETPGYPKSNMQLVSDPITSMFSHSFSVEVIDRFQDGQISITATDKAGNQSAEIYTYCTIKDTLAPVVSGGPGDFKPTLRNNKWIVTVDETRPWDRLIDQITLTNLINVSVNPLPTQAATQGKSSYVFEISIVDPVKAGGWCIQATDLAGNKTVLDCYGSTIPRDVWPPVIALTPPQSQNPWKVTVNINDVHYENSDTTKGPIPYDWGIQEIWFSNNTGMTVGTAARTFSPTVFQVPPFEIFVTDTNDAINETACITIHARDSANLVTSTTWCYPIQGDKFAPVITGVAATDVDIDLKVTDEQLNDRGLRRVELLQADNFKPMAPMVVSGDKAIPVKIELNDPGKSAVGRVQAIDMWGSQATRPEITAMHTSYVDVAMWVQPFELRKSYLLKKSGEFVMSVTAIDNDTFSIDRKGIAKYEFSFNINGDPGVTFRRAETAGTMSAGWNVTPVISTDGRSATIVGIAPAGEVLRPIDSMKLVNLIFNGAESEEIKTSLIEIVPTMGKMVLLNDGQQFVVTGPNSTAILPAAQSSIDTATVVVAGTCTPLVDAGEPSKPTPSIALYPLNPNPIRGTGRVSFKIGETAEANLRLYNSVGDAVLTVAEGEMDAGEYERTFNTDGLSSGTYYLRLESKGKVVSRVVKISR